MAEIKVLLKKTWKFIWEDDSPLSWAINIGLAFVIIKFLVYPGLGFVLGTSHPLVAVVSESMEHELPFEQWWVENNGFYSQFSITKQDFESYTLKNGFNKGDIIILTGVEAQNAKKGDIIVFQSPRPDPIIHRVIDVRTEGDSFVYTTKGDNNRNIISDSDLNEANIRPETVIGKASIKIPLLGYVKIISVSVWNTISGG